jgi:hypothetical protein
VDSFSSRHGPKKTRKMEKINKREKWSGKIKGIIQQINKREEG